MSKAIDTDLKHDLEKELEFNPVIDATKIGIAASDGVVTLTGVVGSYTEKWSAEEAAKHVLGVKALANDLEVVIDTAEYRNDSDIARSALDALKWNFSVPKDKVQVTVSKGWMTLEGEVEWDYQRRAAASAVRNLRGVCGVTNDIVVRPKAFEGDVKDKIQAAFKRSAEIESKNIGVQATDGTVTLSGTVHSWAERENALNAAWSAPGVKNVIDRIAIEA